MEGTNTLAGLTLAATQLNDFKQAFEKAVASRILPEQKEAVLKYDLSIDINVVDHKLYRIVEQMAPFGPQNMRPVFHSANCYDSGESRVVGKIKAIYAFPLQPTKANLWG